MVGEIGSVQARRWFRIATPIHQRATHIDGFTIGKKSQLKQGNLILELAVTRIFANCTRPSTPKTPIKIKEFYGIHIISGVGNIILNLTLCLHPMPIDTRWT